MSLFVYSAKNYSTKLKVTIQGTGRLGFTRDTAKALSLNTDTYIKIAGDSENHDVLYMIICKDADEDGFRSSCISGYYSLATTVLFKELGVDYTHYTVMYDLTREPALDDTANGIVYKMNRRQNPKKKKEVTMK